MELFTETKYSDFDETMRRIDTLIYGWIVFMLIVAGMFLPA